MLRPGEVLTNARGQTAKVRADGTLISADHKGSIHQVGAALEGAPSCNGWTYWHFKQDGRRVPAGVYFVRIAGSSRSLVSRISLVY